MIRNRHARRSPAAFAVAAMLVVAATAGPAGLAGCKSRDQAADQPPDRPAPLTAVERKRGTDACTDYVQRLCACADAHPERAELKDDCYLARSQPDALALALQVDDDTETSVDTVERTQKEARNIIAECIAQAARLPQRGCGP